jgi:hypothetical protein
VPPPSNPPTTVIGCDVGKAHIHIHDSRTRRTSVINNDPSHIAAFSRQLDATCLGHLPGGLRGHRRL